VEGFRAPPPAEDPYGFAEAVLRRAGEGPRAVVIPVTDAAILALLPRRSDLERVADVALPPTDALGAALDKRRTLDAARRAGGSVPDTVAARSERDLAGLALPGPLVVKPASSRWIGPHGRVHGAGPAFAADAAGARAAASALLAAGAPGVLVQRWLPGTGRGVGLLIRGGQVAAAFVHRRLREVHPAGGPSAAAVSEAPDPALVEPAAALLRAMGFEGLAMVEFRREGEGTPVLMEVNPRPWGTLGLAVDAGVDFPRLWLEGHRGPPPAYRAGVRRRWLAGDVRRVLAARAGPPAGYPGVFPSGGAAFRDALFGWAPDFVFRWTDPLPFLAEMAGAL
jgi:predicted ATP-grasp superfamily ATP-dependent carboligase